MSDFLMKSTFLIVSIFLCCMKTSPSSLTRMAGDSLKPGDMLNSTTQLCSTANTFCLQFAIIGQNGDGAFSYLVLRNLMFDRRWLWIGNRNQPVVNNSGELTLDHSGELKIVSQNKPIKVLYSPIQPINDTTAILLDSGNFVLQQLRPNGSRIVLWQSFDYPTDVLLPGMKLGVNYKTNHTRSLVSWIIGTPASGDFTLEWRPIGRELIIRRRGLIYWRSGLLRNNTSFENIPNESIHGFFVVANEDEDYFALTAPKSTEEVSFLGLTARGVLYNGDGVIALARLCYGFNSDGGCQLYDVPRCWKHAETMYGYINFTDIQTSEHVKNNTNSSLTRIDCQRSCWNNCDCVGYFTMYDNDTGCTFLYKHVHVITTLHLNDDNEPKPIIMLTGSLHRKGKRKWIWIGVMIASSLFTISLLILCLVLRKRKFQPKENKRQNSQTTMLRFSESTNINDLQEDAHKMHDLRMFNYASIIQATNGFSAESKLGEGGFGPVYKGTLLTEEEVAVKRLSKTSKQGAVEFTNELALISELQHTNLVQLLGYCIHEEERMLIYEFMPNRSLDFFLFDSTRSNLLSWQKRFNIIEGIAQGLLYLHKYSRFKVIHRDLKASNILLDESMNPKISDFGMARMFTEQESEANTLRIVGTYGYMSPEYAMEGAFSTKSDVYSFGVLLLEIISGRRNSSFCNDDAPFNLVAHAWKLWKEDTPLQLMDPAIIDSYVDTEVLKCIHIGILCIEENANDRPTMSDIISILTNKSGKLSLPKRPAFYTRTNMVEAKTCTEESNINTINEVTLSELDAR